MSCYNVYIESGRKKARLIRTSEEYRALRGMPEQVELLRRARTGDQEAKTKLVQFNYSGHFPNGVVKGNKLPSATFGFDIDDKETFDVVSTVLLASPEEYGLLLLERSVSQGGHAVFKREMGKTILENQVRIATLLECEVDTNAHDINRVYFATSDSPEDLLFVSEELFSDAYDEASVTAEANLLADRERNHLEVLPPGAHKANKHYKPWDVSLSPLQGSSSPHATDTQGGTLGYVAPLPFQGVDNAGQRAIDSNYTRQGYGLSPLRGSSASAKGTQGGTPGYVAPLPFQGVDNAGQRAADSNYTRQVGVGNNNTGQRAESPGESIAQGKTTEGSDTLGINGAHDNGALKGQQLPTSSVAPTETMNYQGIPYSAIIAKWWEMYNGGQTPVTSNRNTLTYDLALHLRHICGFDRVLMAKVIPCYDGFSLQEKMTCIDSAISQRLTQMPLKLVAVLQALRRDYIDDKNVQAALDEVEHENGLFFYNILPKGALPQGVIDSVNAAGKSMVMPVIAAITPMIGMLATNVQIAIHGIESNINLISYICGKAASGKGKIDPIVMTWMSETLAQDKIYHLQEEDYRRRKTAARNSKQQPEEPKLPVRYLPLNNTLANIAERLKNAEGVHSFSFTPEADTITSKWKSGIGDYSVMLRQAFDGSRYEREAKSADAVTVHIEKLLWNVTMCGTPDALYRLITNYTDGLLSRLCIARLPDNTYTPLPDNPEKLLPKQKDRILQVAHLLPLMQGTLVLPKLEKRSREWLEVIRKEALKNADDALADARLRGHVNAYRMTVCLILCLVAERLIKAHGLQEAERMLKADPLLTQEMALRAQTPAILEAHDVIADSLVDNEMFYFREKIEHAYHANSKEVYAGRARGGKNDTIFERLSDTFDFEDAYRQASLVKNGNCTRNSIHQMLKNWRRQGLIEVIGPMTYRKCVA